MEEQQSDPEKFRFYLECQAKKLNVPIWYERSDGLMQPFGSDEWYTQDEFAKIREALNHEPDVMILPEQRPEV